MTQKLLLTIILLALAGITPAQASSMKIADYKVKNDEVIAYVSGDSLKKAQKAAEEAIQMAIGIFGETHKETAISRRNLGDILRMRKKYSESVSILELALRQFQNSEVRDTKLISGTLESLGTSLALAKQFEKAEDVFVSATEFTTKTFGAESLEMLSLLRIKTYFFILSKQKDRAESSYFKRYELSYKLKGEDSEETELISDEHYCFCASNFDMQESLERKRAFDEAAATLKNADSDIKLLRTGVVTGKAILFPQPDIRRFFPGGGFPRGQVIVKVLIGKDGVVRNAKAFCGNKVLYLVSEDAAGRAKFEPTVIDGEVVEVSGFVTYRYQ